MARTVLASTWMRSTKAALITALAACGGGGAASRTPKASDIALEPAITLQQWYRSPSTCAQGPYAVDLPVEGARWGEDFELRVHTPRRVELHAAILVDGAEVDHAAGVFDGGGQVGGKADNARCLADVHERLILGRPGGGAPGTPATPGPLVTPGTASQPSVAAQLVIDPSPETSSVEVLHFALRDRPARAITIRFWSIDPNDLAGVAFGVARIAWRPNVSDAVYAAHVAKLEADRVRVAIEAQRRDEESRRQHATVAPVIEVDAYAEWRTQEEARRTRAIAEALEADRVRRRTEFCDGHPDDRDCWGAGGYKVHLELEQRGREREQYCAQHVEDARCWSGSERGRRQAVWRHRVEAALAPPKPPDGPPPTALAEDIPPKLSLHADWRPGYWQWTEGTWVWLAGMWRVPESDIVAEQTTTAPVAPPAARVEVVPAAPIRTAVWIAGFWQWSGKDWVWIGGAWQLRPEARASWRAPTWQAHGNVHVLIPGGWVRGGAR